MNSIPGVSIIIPVYKVEQNIERCARSLFDQTFKDIEYIFINDCTPDNSIQILEDVIDEYTGIRKQVKIYHHKENLGVAAARNTGLDKANGEYFLQVDSDDWAEPTMVEELYTKAKADDSDMVWSDFYVDFQNTKKAILRKQNVPLDPTSCIIKILSGSLHAGLWNKLIKRDVCTTKNIHFPEGVNMCEDLAFNVSYLVHAQRIRYINRAFYHYVQNTNSTTIARTRQSFESEFKVVDILEKTIPHAIYGKYIMMYKARIKRNIFFSGLFSKDEYLNCFPESTPYIFIGINRIDKTVIWFTLKEKFQIAKIVLFFSPLYSRIKQTLGLQDG